MTPQDPMDQSGDTTRKFRIGRVESVDLYEIKDSELDALERGSPASLQLNFAIFALSTAFTSFGALETADMTNPTTKTVFIVITVVGLAFGLYLGIQWWRARKSVALVCQTIRSRIRPDGAPPAPPAAGPAEPSSDAPAPGG